mmetsp:Transcript_39157/g.112602  ORF Transcript_39157/g.112602 Transcript_39157/m.112602 type:complete len:146 (-) Transcript_39157:32-469(-)
MVPRKRRKYQPTSCSNDARRLYAKAAKPPRSSTTIVAPATTSQAPPAPKLRHMSMPAKTPHGKSTDRTAQPSRRSLAPGPDRGKAERFAGNRGCSGPVGGSVAAPYEPGAAILVVLFERRGRRLRARPVRLADLPLDWGADNHRP